MLAADFLCLIKSEGNLQVNIDTDKFSGIICPKCSKKLHTESNCLKCDSGHTYDISSCGYVNLLPPHKQGTVPGDNKEMVQARRAFLNNGYYKPLANKLSEVIKLISPKIIADIGCGEGYYTSKVTDFSDCKIIGFDISKFALAYAAKAYKNVSFCVANLHNLPLEDAFCDAILCCFCAYDEIEFARILRNNGKFVLVTPGKRHLFGLKSVLYEEPYENDVETEFENFELCDTYEVSYEISVPHEDIWNLFSMTPYYWKTSKEDAEKLKNIDTLYTEADFIIRVFRKRGTHD